MLDEGSFLEGGANWLKEVVDDRSLKLFQEASLNSFKKFRNVEMFMMNKHKFDEKLSTESDLNVARNILQERENANIREEQIRKKTKGAKPNMADPHIGSHYYPYTINEEEIKSALDWFKTLKDNNVDSGLALKEMSDLSADLYICGTDKEAAKREFFKNEPARPIKEKNALYAEDMGEGGGSKASNPFNFSDIVVRMVERNHVGIKQLQGKDSQVNTTSLSGIEGIGQRLGQSHQNFVSGIKKLSRGFNEIYQRGIQKSVQPAVK